MEAVDSARSGRPSIAVLTENWIFIAGRRSSSRITTIPVQSRILVTILRVSRAISKASSHDVADIEGNAFIYQGDELGMTNYPFRRIEEFDDIEVKNAWKAEVLTKQVDLKSFCTHAENESRSLRTPMQWNDS